MNREKTIPLIIFGVILIIVIIGYAMKAYQSSDYDFEIHFFNAGKADAIVLSKNGKYMMIDTGEEDLADEVLAYFKEHNITRLEYLIITHFDKDHVGSAASIIENVDVGVVLQSNVLKESEYYTNYVNALDSKNITPQTVEGDLEISLSDLEIIVNGPTTIYDNNESNNSSLIVSIVDQDNSFLFMGDSQNARLKDFLASNTRTYQFLKVPYHGNYLKRMEELLNTIEADYAVITSSLDEKEDDRTLELLYQYGVKTYLTRNGSITVLSNGRDIVIKQ